MEVISITWAWIIGTRGKVAIDNNDFNNELAVDNERLKMRSRNLRVKMNFYLAIQ